MTTTVVYDIKGIQQAITSVPRLRYMVGASSLIAQFDQDIAPHLAVRHGADRKQGVTCGGGKGTLFVPDDAQAQRLRIALVAEAHRLGLDIRLGIGADPLEAWNRQDLLPFVPSRRPRSPCGLSGLYPVHALRDTNGTAPAHPVIHRRFVASSPRRRTNLASEAGEEESLIPLGELQGDLVGQMVLQRMASRLSQVAPPFEGFPPLVDGEGRPCCRFMRNTRAEDADREDGDPSGAAGQAALNRRNRWAVLVFDGNDIGRQILAAEQRSEGGRNSDAFRAFMRDMADGLNQLTLDTVAQALADVVDEWVQELDPGLVERLRLDTDHGSELVLPFRPLVAGGDDIQVLCHPDFAFSLGEKLCTYWEEGSQQLADANGHSLWPSTGGRLTSSGGILFLANSYPIAPALAYAHQLLDNAKRSQRDPGRQGAPSPAAIDFETITEGLLDHPEERRARELDFHDPDLDRQIVLTQRPYRVGKQEQTPLLGLAERLQSEPRHALAEVRQALRLPWHRRQAVAWRMAKRHPLLACLLGGPETGSLPTPVATDLGEIDDRRTVTEAAWDIPSDRRQPIRTRLWDAILVVEETHRLQQETAHA